jgi:putative hemolysin
VESIAFEVTVIFLLILANGFFAGSELAIISARRSTIARLTAEGDLRARVVDRLQKDPHSFLATVQIGVTVVGSMASAVGGATAVEYLKPVLADAPSAFVREAAEPLSIGLVVVVISYLSLIFGELAPKTIGLQQADRMALLVARPIQLLATVAGVAVKFLTVSNKAVLAVFRVKPASGQDFITREEVLHAVAEGGEAGALSELERKVIENMLDFSHTAVREVMVPRTRIVAIDIDLPPAQIIRIVRENLYSRYPVYRENVENIIGFVHSKDLLMGPLAAEAAVDLKRILRPAFFVPESKRASELLRELQRRRIHLALVVDEYGGLSGLVTTEDLLEELVGEIEDEHDVGERRRAERLADGSLLVDGLISISDLEELLGVVMKEEVPYETLAGLILTSLGRFPLRGEKLDWKDYLLVCEEVTRTAVVRVRIVRKEQPAAEGELPSTPAED